eukprot:scaffold662915_cov41-Prasinocladus_malaysianus.AAC.1
MKEGIEPADFVSELVSSNKVPALLFRCDPYIFSSASGNMQSQEVQAEAPALRDGTPGPSARPETLQQGCSTDAAGPSEVVEGTQTPSDEDATASASSADQFVVIFVARDGVESPPQAKQPRQAPQATTSLA